MSSNPFDNSSSYLDEEEGGYVGFDDEEGGYVGGRRTPPAKSGKGTIEKSPSAVDLYPSPPQVRRGSSKQTSSSIGIPVFPMIPTRGGQTVAENTLEDDDEKES